MKYKTIDTLIRVILVVSLIAAFLLQLSGNISQNVHSTLTSLVIATAMFMNAWKDYQLHAKVNGSVLFYLFLAVGSLILLVLRYL